MPCPSNAPPSPGSSRRGILAGVAAVIAASAALNATAIAAAKGAAPPDPIFAAIERYKQTFAAFMAHCDTEEQVGETEAFKREMRALVASSCGARSDLARTVPTTPAGLAALTSFLRDTRLNNLDGAAPGFLDDEDDVTPFACSLDTAVRGMAGLKPWEGIPPTEPDPIFAAIEESRKAGDALEAGLKEKSRADEAWLKDYGHLPPDISQGFDEAYLRKLDENVPRDIYPMENGLSRAYARKRIGPREVEQLKERYRELVEPHARAEEVLLEARMGADLDLISTVPTTMLGLAALLRYERERRDNGDTPFYSSEYRAALFMSSIEEAACALAGLPCPEAPKILADEDEPTA